MWKRQLGLKQKSIQHVWILKKHHIWSSCRHIFHVFFMKVNQLYWMHTVETVNRPIVPCPFLLVYKFWGVYELCTHLYISYFILQTGLELTVTKWELCLLLHYLRPPPAAFMFEWERFSESALEDCGMRKWQHSIKLCVSCK